MKKRTKVLLSIVLIVFLISTIGVVFNQIFELPSVGGYEISSISKTINVSDNNVYTVTDSMAIEYTRRDAKLIYRIPIREGNYDIKVSDINVYSSNRNVNYTLGKKGDKAINVIFNDNGYIGKDNLSINYKINKGEDFNDTKDSVKFQLFDTKIAPKIYDLSFNIELPKAIAEDDVAFFIDAMETNNFDYKVINNTISGCYKNENNNDLTNDASIMITLSNGYFKHPRNYKMNNNFLFIIYLIITIIFAVLWFFKGKDDEIVASPCFYAPDGLNPLEIGYWIDGSLEYSDIFYMLIHWANEGYIRIEKLTKKDDTDGKTNFIFRKLRELDINKPEYEKIFFKAFFELGDEETTKNEFHTKVFRTETDALYGTLQTYADSVYEGEQSFIKHVGHEEHEGYDKSAESLFKFMKFGCAMLWILAIYLSSGKNAITVLDYMPMLMVIVTVGSALFVPKDGFSVFITYVSPILLLTSFAIVDTRILVLILIDLFITVFVRKRTFKYNELLGKIYGFKNVISKSRYKQEIMDISKSNSHYFYQNLPYAFVLFKTKHWMNQFDEISSPDWFISMDGEGLNKSNIEDFMTQIEKICDEILDIVNMSAVADKKKVAREGLGYVSVSDRLKSQGLTYRDIEGYDDYKK